MKSINRLISSTLLILVLSSCNLLLMGNRETEIRPGMTAQQVYSIMGQPDETGFNHHQQNWNYYKENDYRGRYLLVIIFDDSDRVVALRRHNIDGDHHSVDSDRPIYIPSKESDRPYYDKRLDPIRESVRTFDAFYKRVRNETFDDNKLTLIRDRAYHAPFLVNQCVSLMKLFTFDGEKMKVIRAVTPAIVDLENGYKIIDNLTFSDAKSEARKILNSVSSRNDRPQGRRNIRVISDEDYKTFIISVRNASFTQEKMALIKSMASSHVGFTCSQVEDVMNSFTIDSQRLDAAKYLIGNIVDPHRSYILLNALNFSSNKKKLSDLLSRHNLISPNNRFVLRQNRRVISDEDYKTFIILVRNASFTQEKIALIKSMASSHVGFTCSQVEDVMNSFTIDSQRLDAAKYLIGNIVDPHRSYILLNALNFSSNKKKLSDLLSQYNRERR